MIFKIWTISDTITNFVIGVRFGYYNAWRRVLDRLPGLDKSVVACFDLKEDDDGRYYFNISGAEKTKITADKQFIFWYLPNYKPYEHNFKYKHDFKFSTRS